MADAREVLELLVAAGGDGTNEQHDAAAAELLRRALRPILEAPRGR